MYTHLPPDVHQGMLETVVPKTVNAAVMIVGGKKHRGQVTCIMHVTKGIPTYRKGIYSSYQKLIKFGYEITSEKGGTGNLHVTKVIPTHRKGIYTSYQKLIKFGCEITSEKG